MSDDEIDEETLNSMNLDQNENIAYKFFDSKRKKKDEKYGSDGEESESDGEEETESESKDQIPESEKYSSKTDNNVETKSRKLEEDEEYFIPLDHPFAKPISLGKDQVL